MRKLDPEIKKLHKREYSRKWRLKNLNKMRAYGREWMRKYRLANPEKTRLANKRWIEKGYGRKYHSTVKQAVMNLYGGRCNCCGEANLPFLSLDHIIPIRKKGPPRVRGLKYLSLLRQPKDPNLQVLCHNCNVAKKTKEFCPHVYLATEALLAS
mgnify:CR=1 FL=1